MKYFITILFISFFITSHSQPVVNRAGPANTVQDSRLMALYNLVIPRFVDTTSANLQKGVDSCGAIIFVYTGNKFYGRQCNPKAWIEITTGTPTVPTLQQVFDIENADAQMNKNNDVILNGTRWTFKGDNTGSVYMDFLREYYQSVDDNNMPQLLFRMYPDGAGGNKSEYSSTGSTRETGVYIQHSNISDSLLQTTIHSGGIPNQSKDGQSATSIRVRPNELSIWLRNDRAKNLRITNPTRYVDTTISKPFVYNPLDSTAGYLDYWPGGGGGGSIDSATVFLNPASYLPFGVGLASATVEEQTAAWKETISAAQAGGYGINFRDTWTVRSDSLVVTNRLFIRGVADSSRLQTYDSSGAVITINIPTPRQYYNVVFPSYKSAYLRDFAISYVGGDSTPNTNQRGILITVDNTISFNHRLSNLVVDHFWVGMEFHNVANAEVSGCLFTNNLKYDFLNTNNESQDYGKLIFTANVMRTHDTVSGLSGARPSAAIKLEGGAGFNIFENNIYGYHTYGIWAQYQNTIEFFTSVASTEHNYANNTISFPTDYGIVMETAFGKSGSGPGIFNGNRLGDVFIMNNRVNNTRLIKFDGGADGFTNVKVMGNGNTTVTDTVGAVIDLGGSIRNLTWTENTINAQAIQCGCQVAGVTKPVIITSGSIAGFVYAADNHYIDFPQASDLVDWGTLQDVTDRGNTTTDNIYMGNGLVDAPIYMPLRVGTATGVPDVAAIGVTGGSNKFAYIQSNVATNSFKFDAYDFTSGGGGPLNMAIGGNGGDVLLDGHTFLGAGRNLTIPNLTAGRMVYTGTGGILSVSSDAQFNGSQLGLGTAATARRLTILDNSSTGGIDMIGNDNPAVTWRKTAGGPIEAYGPLLITSAAGFFPNAIDGDFGFRSVSGRVLIGSTYTTSGLTVTAGGVGVFTTGNPAYALDVSGVVRSTTGALLATSSGNVGIGNTSPASKLHIGTAGSVAGIFAVSGSTSGTITFQPQAAAGTYNWNWPTSSGTAGQPLLSGGGGSSAMTFGTLGVPAGGTGQTTYTDGQLLIGNTTGNTLNKSTLTAGTGISITNGAGSITIATNSNYITSADYTPTLTNVANTSAPAAYVTRYYRVGDDVHVYGKVDFTVTTTLTLTQLGISFPVASAIATDYEVEGIGSSPTITSEAVTIIGDVANSRALISFTPTATGARTVRFHFTYKITPP